MTTPEVVTLCRRAPSPILRQLCYISVNGVLDSNLAISKLTLYNLDATLLNVDSALGHHVTL